MYILVVGLYWSGSGAIIDWLKDFPEVEVVRGEFDIFRRYGKISSIIVEEDFSKKKLIAQNLLKQQKNIIIRRKFISDNNLIRLKNLVKRFINIFVEVKYKIVKIDTHPYDNSAFANKITVKYLKKYLVEIKNLDSNGEIEFWQNWFTKLMQPFSSKKKIVLDQPVYLTKHVDIWTKIIKPFKVVMVHRKPIDQFAEIIRTNSIYIERGYMIDPHDNESFYDKNNLALSFVKMMEKKYKEIKKNMFLLENKFMAVSFEKFILNYDNKSEEIKKFLELKNKEYNNFDPQKSAQNIGIGNKKWAIDKMKRDIIRFDDLDKLRNDYFKD